MEKKKSDLVGDLLGGLASMLVALPSAIAFGVILYAPLGLGYTGNAAVAGIIGTIILGLIASFFGGTSRLISAPCAPAAALLAIFVAELLKEGLVPPTIIPFYVAFVSILAGIMQFLAGCFTLGKFIKYIPYPVVAGYLNAVSILILLGQIPAFLGFPKESTFFQGLFIPSTWHVESVIIGSVSLLAMVFSPKFFKRIPSVFISLLFGIISYFVIALFNVEIFTSVNNPLIIGSISFSASEAFFSIVNQWSYLDNIGIAGIFNLLVPAVTLAILLSIDSLKTCVILDVMTQSRHNSNRELVGQGLGNIASAALGGIVGSGVTGATLINIVSGAKTNRSSVFAALFAAVVLFLLVKLVAWIPLAALAGVLIVIAIRMLDKTSIQLLKSKSTLFDFFVILAVVVSAITMSLVIAAAIGTVLAIILFLREQIRSSVVRRKFLGNQKFSKKQRITKELSILQAEGKDTVICELQGPLFFGTTDQLFTELETYLTHCLFVVFDMRRVQSLDFTAANMLRQIHNRVKERNGYLILTSVPSSLPTGQNVKEYLLTLGFGEMDMNLKIYQDLDSALEWIEDEIISKKLKNDVKDSAILDLSEFEFFAKVPQKIVEKISLVVKEKTYQSGEPVFSMGDESNDIYFLRKGTVKINLSLSRDVKHHLLTLSKGSFFGEMSFLDKGKRSANAIAIDEVMLYSLSRSQFEELSKDMPEILGYFFESLAYTLSKKLRLTNIELIAEEEG